MYLYILCGFFVLDIAKIVDQQVKTYSSLKYQMYFFNTKKTVFLIQLIIFFLNITTNLIVFFLINHCLSFIDNLFFSVSY